VCLEGLEQVEFGLDGLGELFLDLF
jgi:hypothetical protein